MNDVRIPEQTYITLKLEDKLRFGYDILVIKKMLGVLMHISHEESIIALSERFSLYLRTLNLSLYNKNAHIRENCRILHHDQRD